MIDWKLDPLTHDIVIENGDAVLIEDVEGDPAQIEQHLKIKLWLFKGEWFLDTSVGVPYFEDILVKNPNIPNIESILKQKILSTPGVNEILEFSIAFDRQARNLTVDFKADTDFGVATVSG